MKNIFFLLSLLLITGCVIYHDIGWRDYDAGEFVFKLPPDMKKVSAHGVDSYVLEFVGTNVILRTEFGKFSEIPSTITDSRQSDFISHYGRINGEEVHINSFRRVPRGGNQFDYNLLVNFSNRGLTFVGNCKAPSDYDTVVKIVRSTKFKTQFDKSVFER